MAVRCDSVPLGIIRAPKPEASGRRSLGLVKVASQGWRGGQPPEGEKLLAGNQTRWGIYPLKPSVNSPKPVNYITKRWKKANQRQQRRFF